MEERWQALELAARLSVTTLSYPQRMRAQSLLNRLLARGKR